MSRRLCARAHRFRVPVRRLSAANDVRILSLLPSATEIVGGLGLASQLVGVTHECDAAPTATELQAALARGAERVTFSDIDATMAQGEIDGRVKASLRDLGSGSLYGVDAAAVARARPTVVLTQTLCDVCAPSAETVARAVAPVS